MGRRYNRVAVLMGGPSAEREVSLRSGSAVADGLRAAGYDVEPVDVVGETLDLPDSVEAAFIALHGHFGEDGAVQAVLEEKGVPYTGSGAAASRRAFDKLATKRALGEHGIPTPRYEVLNDGQPCSLSLPVVVKPARQGSSIGLHRVMEPSQWDAAVSDARSFAGEVVVEEFIPGRELTVGIVGDQVLPVLEIRAPDGHYDYRAKYTSGLTEYLVPAPVDGGISRACQETAMAAFRALACRALARVDFRLDEDGQGFVLEINTIPGFTETSLLPKAAAAAGIDFPSLCGQIMEMAGLDRS